MLFRVEATPRDGRHSVSCRSKGRRAAIERHTALAALGEGAKDLAHEGHLLGHNQLWLAMAGYGSRFAKEI